MPAEELAHCIRESLTYLTQYGAACALHQEGSGSVGSRDAQAAYDFLRGLPGSRAALAQRA